jgi:hypothetical protein
LKDGLELTPVAIKAGRFLARRLYAATKIYLGKQTNKKRKKEREDV